MIGASKILTVSYGTFSCTLEGFDEPFNTMKAIAEYFRDLAAEDRYFGAEPPTPDAAMLHKIAEREIQRRVEAKIQDNGVILRAGETNDLIDKSDQVAQPVAPSLVDTAPLDANGESVAERLSRLRHSQKPAPAQEAASTPAPLAAAPIAAVPVAQPQDDYTEDQHADALSDKLLANLESLTTPQDIYITDDSGFDDFAEAEEVIAPNAVAEIEISEPPTETPAPAVEERAVETSDLDDADLGIDSDLPTEEPEITEPSAEEIASVEEDFGDELGILADLHAMDAVPAEVEHEAVAPQELEEPVEPDAATAVVYAALAETSSDDAEFNLDALIAKANQVEETPLIEEADHITEAVVETADEVVFEPAAAAEVELTTIDLDDAAIPDAAEAEDLPSAVLSAEEALAEALGIDAPEARAMFDDAPKPVVAPQEEPRARARVIKVRRIDPTAPPKVIESDPTTLLSSESEAALKSELAAIMSETDAPKTTPAAGATQPVRPTRPVRPNRPVSADPSELVQTDRLNSAPNDGRHVLNAISEDDSVNRLLAQANTALEEPESRRRSAAIALLKAAVAATKAERQIQATEAPKPATDRSNVYRSDLDNAVRGASPEAERSADERPRPLVLVSEQRIDRSQAATNSERIVTPMRPLRAAPTAAQAQESLIGGDQDDEEDALSPEEATANLFATGTNFADFAESLGAESLHDLLEASAVYCAQVLGRPQFSRPMVMSQINTLPNAESHPLEDQLRAFGTLMREGRITKIKRGAFAVTDRSPLLAEALRNAG